MVKFKLKGTLINALMINETTGESSDITAFVSKRYKVRTDRSIKSMINQSETENPELVPAECKVIYIKSFEPSDKLFGMNTADFLRYATELKNNDTDENESE